jgi:dTDP-4-dehydrorhamnose reductase
MKVFVIGASGMLGKYVSAYLSRNFEVISLTRDKLNAAKVDKEQIVNILKDLNPISGDVIVNCAGVIKPRVDELGVENALLVNSVFPHYLSYASSCLSLKLVHITTDCVFSGLKGKYTESDFHDVHDIYGRSKSLGEPNNCTVIRTSIIGEETGNKRSLIEWIKSNRGKSVFGYTNHFWNGLTCLQVAKVIGEMIENNIFWQGVRHVFSPDTLNKYELVSLVSTIYELEIQVKPQNTPEMCDRSLATNFPTFKIPHLESQIREMKFFKLF